MFYRRYAKNIHPGCSLRVIHNGTHTIAELWIDSHEGTHTMRVDPSTEVADRLAEAGGGVKAFLSLWESLPRDTRNTHWPTRLPVGVVPSVK